ncbi:MAG: DUF859 domain-containing protein [Peptococcaceae bacterium]|nr:DUF859 domain-containing protein [Peptococcaceae bacterium]
MASSGSFNTSAYNHRYLAFEWWLNNQNISANKSNIGWRLVGAGSTASPQYYVSGNFKVIIDGVQRHFSATRINLFSGTVVASGNCDISHNSDGSRSFTATAEAGIYYTAVNVSGSGSWALNTIPRASEFSLTPSNKTIVADNLNMIGVSITPLIAGATHDIKYQYGGYSHTQVGVGSYAAYTVPKEWINASPNTATGSGTITVTTKNGSTVIGSKTETFYLTAPADVVPTIGDVAVTRIDNDVPPQWGLYIQNHSAVKIEVLAAAGAYGSGISKCEIKSSDFMSSQTIIVTDKLPRSGPYPFVITVTDTRGRTATEIAEIQVEAYKAPSISSAKVDRCLAGGAIDDDGTYVLAQIADTVYSLLGNNTIQRRAEYRRVGQSSWTAGGPYTKPLSVIGAGLIDVDYSYEIKLTLQDSFSAVSVAAFIPTAFTTVDYRAGGKGIAFGQVAQEEGFTCAMAARFRARVAFDNLEQFLPFLVSVLDGYYTGSWEIGSISASTGGNSTAADRARMPSPIPLPDASDMRLSLPADPWVYIGVHFYTTAAISSWLTSASLMENNVMGVAGSVDFEIPAGATHYRVAVGARVGGVYQPVAANDLTKIKLVRTEV